MPLVIVGHRAGATFLHRQSRLGAVERLDLALEIKPDNVCDLLGKMGIARQLEGSRQVRFKGMRQPNPLYRCVRNAGRLRHGAHAPMRRPRWLGVERHIQHSLDRIARQRLAAGRLRRVLQQPLNAFVAIASPLAPHRQKAFAHCGCNRPGTHSLASQKNDPRSPDHLLRRVAIPDETFQPLPICFSNCNSFDLAHNAGIPRFIRFGNRPSVTDHCGQVISHGEQI